MTERIIIMKTFKQLGASLIEIMVVSGAVGLCFVLAFSGFAGSNGQ